MTIKNIAKYCLYVFGVLVFLYVVQIEDGAVAEDFLETVIPIYSVIAMVSFPFMYLTIREKNKEYEKLKKRKEEIQNASQIIWAKVEMDRDHQERDLEGYIESLRFGDEFKEEENTTKEE